jgi:TPR repeat protein
LDGLKRAADQGFALPPFNYGVCLYNGEGVSIDFGSAAHYFKLAADQGFALAQYNYGLCLQKGECVSIDFRGAAHYLKLAADQRFVAAQYNYSVCLQKGECVSIDFRGAAHYLKLAADQGFADAQFKYGLCLYKSECISIDFGGAAHYFKLAANQGFAEAQYRLQDSSSLTLDSTETAPVPSIILSYPRQMEAHMASLLFHRWHEISSELPQISSINADTMRSIMHSHSLQWFVVLRFSNCEVRAG